MACKVLSLSRVLKLLGTIQDGLSSLSPTWMDVMFHTESVRATCGHFFFLFFFLRESDISLVNLGLAGVDIVWNFLRSSRPTGGWVRG